MNTPPRPLVVIGMGLTLIGLAGCNTSSAPPAPLERKAELSAGASTRAKTQDLVTEINRLRQAKGLPPVSRHPILTRVAQAQAETLAASGRLRATMESAPDMTERVVAAGYNYHLIAESVASGPARPQAVLDFLLRNPTHRDNLYNGQLRDIGIGHAQERRNAQRLAPVDYWVIEMGTAVSPLPDEATLRNQMLARVNHHRRLNDLLPLRLDGTLNKVAARYAAEMARRGVMSHKGADGSMVGDRMLRAGYDYGVAAENLARNALQAEKTADLWMTSPGHRHNMLIPDITEAGIGVVEQRGDAKAPIRRHWCLVLGAKR